MVFNLVCVIAMVTIPLWAPAICAGQETQDGLVYADDCGTRMIVNATGQCNPRPGELTGATVGSGGIAHSHPDGRITGKETPFRRHFCIKCIIYQDRLGTNIGKAQTRVAFPQDLHAVLGP